MRCTIGFYEIKFLFCCPVFEVSFIVFFFVPRDFLATVSALARTSETLGYAGSFPFNVLRTSGHGILLRICNHNLEKCRGPATSLLGKSTENLIQGFAPFASFSGNRSSEPFPSFCAAFCW